MPARNLCFVWGLGGALLGRVQKAQKSIVGCLPTRTTDQSEALNMWCLGTEERWMWKAVGWFA